MCTFSSVHCCLIESSTVSNDPSSFLLFNPDQRAKAAVRSRMKAPLSVWRSKKGKIAVKWMVVYLLAPKNTSSIFLRRHSFNTFNQHYYFYLFSFADTFIEVQFTCAQQFSIHCLCLASADTHFPWQPQTPASPLQPCQWCCEAAGLCCSSSAECCEVITQRHDRRKNVSLGLRCACQCVYLCLFVTVCVFDCFTPCCLSTVHPFSPFPPVCSFSLLRVRESRCMA